jgi:O-glycosyl hydrolase
MARKVDVHLDLTRVYQTIDGFGVNFNPRYWTGMALLPTMDLLLDDLGATLFRVDIWGRSNWIDPDGELGREALTPDHLACIYESDVFEHGWEFMRYLNECGIEPTLSCSGDLPGWMLGSDGKTLQDYEAYTDMLVSLVEWARRKEDIRFTYFSPMNEPDTGSPKGPLATPEAFVKVCEMLDARLSEHHLDDIRMVVAEQGHFDRDYLYALVNCEGLQKRIGAFGMHSYADIAVDSYKTLANVIHNSSYRGRRLWMSEFGDLDQSGDREWYVAWTMASRLMDHLAAGFHAALAWDAFDSFQEHERAWSISGLLRTGLNTFTPKKRFFALKHFYRFIMPGFTRIEAYADNPDVRVLAFSDPDRAELTVVGMNQSEARTYYLNVDSPTIPTSIRSAKADYYRTSETENCALVDRIPVRGMSQPFTGMSIQLPPDSIFTLTTL